MHTARTRAIIDWHVLPADFRPSSDTRPRERALGAVGVGGLRLRRLHDRTAPARRGGLSPLDAAGGRGRQAVSAARRAGDRPRGRHQPGRRLPAARRGGVVVMLSAHEQDPRDRPPQPHGGGRGGRAQPAAHARPWPAPAITSPPIRRAKAPARSAATWPPTPAARTRSSTA